MECSGISKLWQVVYSTDTLIIYYQGRQMTYFTSVDISSKFDGTTNSMQCSSKILSKYGE